MRQQPSTAAFDAITSNLERTSRGPLILLFYDGYERQALSGLVGGSYSEARRAARYMYRNARGRQVRTGFYTAFLSLVRCLREAGCDVRINDFAAATKRQHYPIGLAGYPTVMDRVRLPNPVIFGPGDFGAPEAARALAADDRFRVLIQPCDWFVDYYRPYCGDKLATWFAGIDLADWPDTSQEPKSLDCLIYDKIRWNRAEKVPAVLQRVERTLDERGLSRITLRYGEHHQSTFRKEVRRARSLIFLCEHETQGLAYQEALASGVPVLAWDEGELADPFLQRFAYPDLTVSSVPYFDVRCGKRFKLSEFEKTFEEFWDSRSLCRPRQYVEQALSMNKASIQYVINYSSCI